MKNEEIVLGINKKISEFYGNIQNEEFIPGKTRVPLSYPSYGSEEVIEVLDSLLSSWVTMGKKVKLFEQLFSEYIGVKYGVMVNSGSSANLLAFSALSSDGTRNGIRHSDEVITPAVTWATSISPIYRVGAIPYLVDVDLETYNMDLDKVEKCISKKTKAIMAVHMLGNPCDMKRIMEIAEHRGLYVIEDTCESHGAEISGRKCGSFGDMSTFSFFFAHHITTMEGGMVLTNNDDMRDFSKSLRAYGWVRDLPNKEKFMSSPVSDDRFIFALPGYNFRPTDVNAAFGIHQVKKIESFIAARRANANYLTNHLSEYSDSIALLTPKPGTNPSWFGYPITVKPGAGFEMAELQKFLETRNIETRPIMTGNVANQPMMKSIRHKKGNLVNSDYITNNSFFFGVNQNLPKVALEYIVTSFEDFFQKNKK